MQQQNETSDTFLRRSDALCSKLRCDLEDLPGLLGFSRASLFGYRNGSRTITTKAWRKLEAAEREAGISSDDASPKQKGGDLAEAVRRNDPLTDTEQTRMIVEAFARANDVVAQIREIAPRVGRWPLPEEDKKKLPWVVLLEYREIEAAQNAHPKTSSSARGKSA